MNWFSNIFRRAQPRQPTFEDRVATLRTGSTDLIMSTVFGDGDEALRAAAIHRLPNGDALRRVAGVSGGAATDSELFSPELERAARLRMAVLIDTGAIDFADFCARATSLSAMFSVAALCEDSSRLPQALAKIEDPAQIAQLVVQSPSSRLRQLAAASIEDPALLRQLIKEVRSKDKSVYKILKQKCDALNADERKAAQAAADIDALCASLERHSRRSYDALYASAFDQLNSRWLALTAQPEPQVGQRARQAIDSCKEVIAAHLRQIERQAARDIAQRTAQQAANESRERALRTAQEAAAAQAIAEAQLHSEAAVIRDSEENVRAAARAAQEQLFRQIGGLIRSADSALLDGHTQRAAALRRSIADKLPLVPAVPAHLTRRLQQLDDKLSELKQWKDYAVAPKRTELIGDMEALIGAEEEPRVLADRIKSLQEEWRTISQGLVSDASTDSERFHQASQAAYQPCREYFAAQAKLRRENLAQRQAVLDRLAAFESAQSGQSCDWRLLASVLREAPQEWRQYFPVDREANRAVQRDFAASLERLQARLDEWYGRNVADKQALIRRARELLAQDDVREAIEAAKRLQILWKETGHAPREQDQSLWSEFRELCDAVYQRRQQANADYIAGLEANKSGAETLCAAAEHAAASSGPALVEGNARLPEWRAAFDALGEMPRSEARGLHDRFERALEKCRIELARQLARDAEKSVMHLIEAGRRVSAYGWSMLGNAEVSERDGLREAVAAFVASVPHWPRGGLQAVKEALESAGSRTDTDGDAHETARRRLCVRCEIMSDTATPPEDEALRREYQVQRLVQGMGQGGRAQGDDWDALMLEWIRIGPIAPSLYENLEARFVRCWSKRPLPNAPRSEFQQDHASESRRRQETRAGQGRRRGGEGAPLTAAR
jgi:Domain of Unknown Function (DUF349)